MYAQLCKRLSEEAPTFEKDAATSSSCTFLRLLIAVCRDKFNNRLKRDITENDVNNQFNKVHRPGAAAAAAAAASSGSASADGDADEEERRHLAKQRMLGNVKFIGELNKLDMLSKNVLHQCIMELLDKKKKRTASAQEMCEDMECLAQLLKTCGKNLDSEQGKELMNQYFDTLERRSKSSDYPPRIRFLLKDVIELRENAWVPRKVGGPTEPVPIKQIRTDDDGQIMRTPFAQQRRGDMRHSDRDGDNWMNRFHLNLQPSGGGFSDMFGSLSVTGASPMMSPFASNSTGRPYNNDRRDRGGGGGQGNYQGNRYNNNKHQQNGGGGGPGGGGGMRDDMRSHQNRDRDSRDSQYGGGGGGRDGGGRDGGGRGGDMGSGGHNSMGKELAPRFKRNLMTPNQDSVENLQMRPGANSLLFKAASQNQKIPTTLPISTPPSGGGLFASSAHQQQKQKDQQLNSQYPLLSTPTSHLGGGASSGGPAGRSSTPSGEYDAGGHNNNAGGGKQQQTDSGFKAVTANEMNSLNNRKASGSSDSNSVGGDKRLAAGSQGGAKANGPAAGQAMNVTKHGSLEKLKPAAPAPGGKQDKKKDKAFNKEEVLKKTAAYIKERFYYTEQEEEEEELAAQRAAEPVEPKVVEVEPEAPEATEEEKPAVASEDQSEAPSEVLEAVAPETAEPAPEAAEKAEVVAAVPAEVAYDKSLSRLLNKVVDGFVELKVPEKCMKDVCLNMLMDIVEKADEKFIERSVLFLQAVLKRISVKANVIVEVFKQVVNKMNEREALNPRIATHVASLLCRAVHQVGLIKLTDVAAYTDNGQHYPLFLLVLQQLHKAVGKSVLEEMFTASKIDLMNNLPEVDRNKTRLGEILDDRNLAFLYPLLKVQAEMQKQLSADPSPSAFYKWIKANVEPKYYKNAGFITSLMTVLLRHITSETSLAEGCDIKKHPEKPIIEKEQNQLLKYAQLLQTFLANNTELQLIAIYALQVFCYEENFPKGMLCRWFKYLYEAEVIEEESFILWKEEISDKYPGKGSALFQVNNWLTWLQEAESEDDED